MKLRNKLFGSVFEGLTFQPPGICSVESMLDFDDAGGGSGGEGDETKEGDQGSGSEGDQPEKIDGPADRMVSYKGEEFEVPEELWDAEKKSVMGEAAAKRFLDLRRKLSEKKREAPESYELTIPKDFEGKVEVDENHPLAKPAMEWAKKNDISQEAFNELTSIFYGVEAGSFDEDKEFAQVQQKQLAEALGENHEQIKAELGQWVGGLLKNDFKENPAMLQAALDLASDANGVMLIKSLKDKIGERGLPRKDSDDVALTKEDLRALQSSEAYSDATHPRHEATVKKVREGYKRLHPS